MTVTDILKGIRVLEVAEYGMVPAAAAVLADWGAEVLKVEHPVRGDAIRGLEAWGVAPGTGGFTYLWEPFNRGKRSIGLDIATEAGREVLLGLVRSADVFLTNFLPEARRKLRIEVADLQSVNPDLIYARGSAHGPRGPESERGGFDGLTYWYRSGAASAAVPAGSDELIPLPGPAFGDIQTGMALAGGIAGALYHRERSGEARVVDTSLLASGMWAMQASLVGSNLAGWDQLPLTDRTAALNPLTNTYRASDGRFVALAMLQADRYWPDFCRLIGRADLIDDPRFVTMADRAANNRECISVLDEIFAERSLADWEDILAKQDGQWAVVQQVSDLNRDEQAIVNGYLQDVDYGDGRSISLVSAPVQFNETAAELRPAPGHGAHTEEILIELGYDWDDVIRLKDEAVIS